MSSPRGAYGQVLRVIDANLNRLGEGLRVLEDTARLLINDAALSAALKGLRHQLNVSDPELQRQLLMARDAGGDVAAFAEEPSEAERPDLPALVAANAHRAQESLRVLEEFSKLHELAPALHWNRFKEARFTLYTLEQRLVAALLRKDKVKLLSGLYLVLDAPALKGRSPIEAARAAIKGGAKVIQLRDKGHVLKDIYKIAQELQELCSSEGALFIVNDYLNVALACGAHGVHLGRDDMPLPQARRLLPLNTILGASVRTLEQALQATSEGADYLAVGSMYPSPSKPSAPVRGLEPLRQIRAQITLPLVAIGGINEDNVGEVLAAGADGVAVISAVLGADDIEAAACTLVRKLEG